MIILDYPYKKSYSEIINSIESYDIRKLNFDFNNNLLIKGDNLRSMKYLLENFKNFKNKIDLIYIDPPYSTNNLFSVSDNRNNTISKKNGGVLAYEDKLTGFKFLEFLRERLVFLRELLSEKGSIYLHIDYKIGHYVKIIMDEIFGQNNFRNDITRIKCNPKNFKRKAYGNYKDLILFYTKTDDYIWNEPVEPYSERDKEKLFPKKDENGRNYTTIPLHAPGETVNGNTGSFFKGIAPPEGRHWRTSVDTLEHWDDSGLIEWSAKGNPRKKIFLDEKEGKRVQDIWEFKDPQNPIYPTEKNMKMLDLIIKTSSNKNSIVLDCFSGSGSTLMSATNNGRRWIGIDQSELAIKTISKRFKSEGLFSTENQYYFIDFEK